MGEPITPYGFALLAEAPQSRGSGAKPPEAEDIFALRTPLSYRTILKFIASYYAFDY